MAEDPHRPTGPSESEQVFSDELLVEAARAGWLSGDSPDQLAGVLAALRDCAQGSCPCTSHDRCALRREP